MIIGIGTDLTEVERIEKACAKEAFLMRYFTLDERTYIQGHAQRVAGNFAVKEAVAKALGTGFRGMQLNEIEVLRDALGKPLIRLYGNAKKRSEALGVNQWHVSISNTKTYAVAFVVAEGVEV